MPSSDSDHPAAAGRQFDGISHGYAPDGRPAPSEPVPLDQIARDVVENLSATAKAELALIEARGELALHGATWSAAWGAVAACALGVAMLALAFGAILALAPHTGPFVATLIVVAALLAIAGLAGWRAHRAYGDIRTALRRDLVNEGIDD